MCLLKNLKDNDMNLVSSNTEKQRHESQSLSFTRQAYVYFLFTISR